MKPIFMILMSICIGIIGQLMLKKGAITLSVDPSINIFNYITKVFSNYYLILGLALYAISALIWINVLSKVDLSYAYPMIAMSYVVVALLATVFFNEQISLIRWSGIAFIIAGVILISRS